MKRSSKLLAATVLASAVFAGGCSDASPTASGPAATVSGETYSYTASDSFTYTVPDGVSDADLATGMSITIAGGVRTVSFTVYPTTRATLTIDDHKIAFEPNAICDTLQSSYGPAYWDAPCAIAQEGVRITARSWYTPSGKPLIDFQPALRFNPASRVTLYLKNKSSTKNEKIFYVSPEGQLVDESLTDTSLVTRTGGGYKYRRIKHFSGYTVSTSRTQSLDIGEYLRPSVGPMTVGSTPVAVSTKPFSGHVVATGAQPAPELQP